MSEEEPDEQAAPNAPADEDPSKSDARRRSRPRTLTSEQRRLLGTPRPLRERVEAEKEIDEPAPVEEMATPPPREREAREAREPREPQKPAAKEKFEEEPVESEPASEEPEPGPRVAVRRDEKSSRAIEMQHAAVIIGALVALVLTFYVGKKFEYWRYLWMQKNKPKLTEKIPDKFPGVSANELVEQALASERANLWRDAAQRMMAAKSKDLRYRGILYRVAKMAYDRGDFDNADKLSERAVAFGENIDTANYLRGLIATRHRDLTAAERFFEAAATAEPFMADYYYYWAEALRMDHHPHDAVTRYEQAAHRARDDQDATVCQFKVRIARLEGGENEKVKAEIEEKGRTGSLPLDWLMTDAALAIREGRIEDAVRSVYAARSASTYTDNGGGIFVSCTSDMLFQAACQKHRELADACEAKATSP